MVPVLLTGCGAAGESSTAPSPSATRSSASAGSSSAADAATPSATASAVTSATTLDEATGLAARDGFPLLVPTHLPDGWRVVSADYAVEGRGTWSLDLSDQNGGDVGVRQARPDVPAAYVADIGTYLGSGARSVGPIDVPPLGTWDRYEGVRHPRAFAVGKLEGTEVILWADDEASLARLVAVLRSV